MQNNTAAQLCKLAAMIIEVAWATMHELQCVLAQLATTCYVRPHIGQQPVFQQAGDGAVGAVSSCSQVVTVWMWTCDSHIAGQHCSHASATTSI